MLSGKGGVCAHCMKIVWMATDTDLVPHGAGPCSLERNEPIAKFPFVYGTPGILPVDYSPPEATVSEVAVPAVVLEATPVGPKPAEIPSVPALTLPATTCPLPDAEEAADSRFAKRPRVD